MPCSLPKTLIEQARLGEDLDIEVRGETLVIRPAHRLRGGWAEAALTCHGAGGDELGDWDATTGDDWS